VILQRVWLKILHNTALLRMHWFVLKHIFHSTCILCCLKTALGLVSAHNLLLRLLSQNYQQTNINDDMLILKSFSDAVPSLLHLKSPFLVSIPEFNKHSSFPVITINISDTCTLFRHLPIVLPPFCGPSTSCQSPLAGGGNSSSSSSSSRNSCKSRHFLLNKDGEEDLR